MPIEETYPALLSNIQKAREAGYSDIEINDYIRGGIREALKSGYTVPEVTNYLGQSGPTLTERMGIRRPAELSQEPPAIDLLQTDVFRTGIEDVSQPVRSAGSLVTGPMGDIVQGALETAAYPVETAAGMAGGMAVAAARPLAAGAANLAAMISGKSARKLERMALEAVEKAAPYIAYQPQGKLARTTLEVGTSPFTGAAKGLEALGVPEEIAGPAIEAGALTLPVIHAAFKNFKGRSARSNAEIAKTIREEPAFVEELRKSREKPGIVSRETPKVRELRPEEPIDLTEVVETPDISLTKEAGIKPARSFDEAVNSGDIGIVNDWLKRPSTEGDVEYPGGPYRLEAREEGKIYVVSPKGEALRDFTTVRAAADYAFGANQNLALYKIKDAEVNARTAQFTEDIEPEFKRLPEPRVEPTEAGMQGVFDETPARETPRTAAFSERSYEKQVGELAKEEVLKERKEKIPEEPPFEVPGGQEGEFEPGAYGFPEFKTRTPNIPQSISPTKKNFIIPAKGKPDVIGRADIIRDLQSQLEVPIRVGHGDFGQRKAKGFFKGKEEVVRLKKANDLETTAHEVGHFLSKTLLKYQFSKKKPGGRQFDAELTGLGKDLYGSRQPHGGYAEEGIAEFVGFFITDPAKAQAKAPKFFDHFTNLINTEFPDVRDVLHKARQDYKRYQEQPAVAKVLSQISIDEKQARVFTLDDLYTATVENLHPFELFRDRMNKGKPPLSPIDDPHILARLMRGWMGKADLFLNEGTLDYGTLAKNGKGLKEILAPVEADLNNFRAYITSRRALELSKRGKETGISVTDAQTAIDQTKNPVFEQAFNDLQQYQDAGLRYLKDSGVLSEKVYAKIKTLNEEYVPFYRLMEEEAPGSLGGGGGRTYANLFQPVKRIKGSAREIIDPLESIIKNTYTFLNIAERNAVGDALTRLAGKTEGGGKFVEAIPTPKAPVTLKDIELQRILRRYSRIKETKTFQTAKKEFSSETGVGTATSQPVAKMEAIVKDSLQRRGFTEGEANVFIAKLKGAKTPEAVDNVITKIIQEQTIIKVTRELELDLPPYITEIFRPSMFIPKDEPIVSVWKAGEKKLYRLHPDLYKAMLSLDRESSGMLVRLFSIPARLLRLGATTMSPEFAVRNPVRDQWTAYINSQTGYKPGIDFVRGVFHILKNDDVYHAWKAGGGEHSMLVSLDRPEIQKTLKDLTSGPKAKALNIVRHPIDFARMLSELGEAGTRVGEFARGLEQFGSTKEGILRAAFEAREITVDFAKQGTKMSAVRSLIAFANANIQGGVKTFKTMKDHPTRTLIRGGVSITLPSILLYISNRDDPRYQELPRWQKDLFWIIPSGDMDSGRWAKMSDAERAKFSAEHTIWRVPKPFEYGLIFGTAPERIMDWLDTHDPKVLNDFWKSIKQGFLPNVIPTAVQPLIENMANYSLFRERSIVPKGKEGVEAPHQFTPYTTETAKFAGRVLNYPPPKIENLVRGYTGGFGGLMLEASDRLVEQIGGEKKSEKPAGSIADIPGVRGFVARFPGQAESVERFYQAYEKSQEAANTLRQLRRSGKTEEVNRYTQEHRKELAEAPRLAFQAKRLSDIRKAMDRIRQSDISPEQKKARLDELTFRAMRIAEASIKRPQFKSYTAPEKDVEPSYEATQ